MSRRKAILGLAGAFAASPVLRAQLDPRPLREHRRVPGFTEMHEALDFEGVFFANQPRAIYDYTAHGDGSEFTLRRNREAFGWVDIVARAEAGTTIDPARVDMSSEIFGVRHQWPLFICPTAAQGPLHPQGELGMRLGAIGSSTTMIVPNGSSVPLEKIAAAGSFPFWFQFYPRPDLDESRDVLMRAQAAGAQAVVVTIDQQASAYERSLHNRNLGGAPSTRTPPKTKNPYRVSDGRLWYSWQYLDEIRKVITVRMLAKGILTVEDALLCVEHGIDGIVVSNHGGRSLDYGPSSLEVLPAIVDAVKGRVPVLVDSGFRRGTDILKALAIGANGVCMGRAARWGLGSFGPEGVQRVFEILQAELTAAMAGAGKPSLASLDRSAIRMRFS
jgi:isopentenyl diphosphate isomerase/L-lactate dehydrogenase-like FMN-dependent dehydrogenase